MFLDEYSFINYLERELIFWKSMKAVYINKSNKEDTKKLLFKEALKHYDEKIVMKMAVKRFVDLTKIIGLFKTKYREEITKRVNKELNTNYKNVLDLEEIKHSKDSNHHDSQTLKSFGIPEIVTIAIIVIVIGIVTYAEAHDNNGVQEDDTIIVGVDVEALSELVDTSTWFTCDEISALDYGAFVTYLVMTRTLDHEGWRYGQALICASCQNFYTYCQCYNFRHDIILSTVPGEPSIWYSLFYALKCFECKVPI